MTVDAKGRGVTWAMRLGLEMHEVAMTCAGMKLGVNFEEQPRWRRYPVGHRYEGKLQGDIYREAFGPEVELIGPREGVFW
ncbi:hypothetical protein JQX13_09825 [Archangium violaceum]|uniref:hypothetical protein n=1 Tax=Archangium violaceum TaxID=83451 RepID=UPI00193C6115|nr:hypothetical protein [Archangium violaceum]QRK10355.1 hypothetical protein JQX13_09825 [Archangium violaceum]